MSESDKIVAFPTRAEMDAAAAAWYARLDGDDVTAEDRAAFGQWIAESEHHKAAFERVATLWDGFGVLKELEDIALSAEECEPSKPPLITRRKIVAMAASIVMVVGVGVISMLYTSFTPERYATGVGEQKTIRLKDGSEVQLNTDTQILVKIDDKARHITLERGEAHFEVATDPQRPFSVFAGKGVFTAVGTAYTVRLRPGAEVEVTVSEGRIAMAAERALAQVTETTETTKIKDQHLLGTALDAGQNAVFTDKVESIVSIEPNVLTRKASWRLGLLTYQGEPLSEVVADVSRYTDINIEISDAAIQSLPVGGTFRVGEIDAMFDALEVTFGLQIEYVDDKSIKISRAS
ncbi:FecR domain-containing protein [Hyphococcus formosus]|uniref:FecR family protein n=1 Tax=Hyphococcus formosus TaxID=3143534 RepID=UPI00398AFB75